MPPSLIDTHAHLNDAGFDQDRAEILERARQAGVERIVLVAVTAQTSARCVELARQYGMLSPTVGIQPNHVAEESPDAWDKVAQLAREPGVCALGETGLDRHWDRTPFPLQE